MARDLGVDLGSVKGSGDKGRIVKEDVEAAAKGGPSPQPSPAGGSGSAPMGGIDLLPWPKVDFAKFGPVEVKPLSRIKKISGANLHRNWVMIPHVTNHDDADITELEAFRVQLNKEIEKGGVKVSMLAFMIKAAVAALKKFPEFNARSTATTWSSRSICHIGFAADTPNGLVVPVIRDADKKGVVDIAKEMGDLAKLARDGKLKPDQMQGGTFTISEPGRHRRHVLHADHQRARGRDHGRMPLVLEAGVERRQDVVVALHAAAVAVVGPPRDRRRRGRALQRVLRVTAGRHAPDRIV